MIYKAIKFEYTEQNIYKFCKNLQNIQTIPFRWHGPEDMKETSFF